MSNNDRRNLKETLDRGRMNDLYLAAFPLDKGVTAGDADEETPSPVPSAATAAVDASPLFESQLPKSTAKIRVRLDAGAAIKWTIPASTPSARAANTSSANASPEEDAAQALLALSGQTAVVGAAAAPQAAATSGRKRKREVAEPEPDPEQGLQRGGSRRSLRIQAQGPKKYGK